MSEPEANGEREKQEFHALAVECKQFLAEHDIEMVTDTLPGHMAVFIQRKLKQLRQPRPTVEDAKLREKIRKQISAAAFGEELGGVTDEVMRLFTHYAEAARRRGVAEGIDTKVNYEIPEWLANARVEGVNAGIEIAITEVRKLQGEDAKRLLERLNKIKPKQETK